MRRVEKPIKCLPVSDIQKMGLRCLLLNQSDCSSDSPQPMRGQQILSWSSKNQTQVIDLISSGGWFLLDVCWVTKFLHEFQSPVNTCREPLAWPGTVSLLRAPGCAVMSHEEHHRTNISCHRCHGMAHGGREMRHKLGHYLELWG